MAAKTRYCWFGRRLGGIASFQEAYHHRHPTVVSSHAIRVAATRKGKPSVHPRRHEERPIFIRAQMTGMLAMTQQHRSVVGVGLAWCKIFQLEVQFQPFYVNLFMRDFFRQVKTLSGLLIPLFMVAFIIDVEFLNVQAKQASSIWLNDRMLRSSASESILRCLSRMLHESIDADVTINTGEGASKSHKAIL
ncbi:hypothetical protein Tco_0435224 [Tanacetum coccineum]